jgi:hypothetical protein
LSAACLGYKGAMKNAHVAALVLVAIAVGCHSSSSGGGAGGATSAAPGSSTPAPAADKAPEIPTLAGFEGEVDMVAKGSTSPAPVPINMLVKNETLRIDVPQEALDAQEARAFTGGGKVYAIIKPSDKTTLVVLDGKREAVLINLDTVADQAKAFRAHSPGGAEKGKESPPKVVKTGKKEMVAGYSCEDWDITNADKSKLTTCVAEQGASFFHFPSLGIPSEHAWALELVDGKHLPLKGIAFGKDGAETGRLEVTKIDKHPLDAALFAVPAGYKQVSIEEMMQGLGGGAVPGETPHGVPHGGPHHHHGKH